MTTVKRALIIGMNCCAFPGADLWGRVNDARAIARLDVIWAAVLAAAFVLTNAASAQVIFSDDFNRPDGPVGNGWTEWGGGAEIQGQELLTRGQNQASGGVIRSLTVAPGFEFDVDYHDGSDENALQLYFNAVDQGGSNMMWGVLVDYTGSFPGQITVFGGSGAEESQFLTLITPVSGDRLHVHGCVPPDLSSSITVTVNDDLTETLDFGSIQDPGTGGSNFVLGNASSINLHFFDNLVITQGCTPTPVNDLSWGRVKALYR